MPRIANKHANATMVQLNDFTGGLNLIRPPEFIGNNELQVAENFEFSPDTGALRVRSGMELVYRFPSNLYTNLRGLIPVSLNPEEPLFIARVDAFSGSSLSNRVAAVYQDGTSTLYNDLVDGEEHASFVGWGDAGDREVVFCFGKGIFKVNAASNTLVKLSPATPPPDDTRIVFVDAGRLVACPTDGDEIRWSSVGDPTKWGTGTAGDGLFAQVGYKDGSNIRGAIQFAGEIIVFKSPNLMPEDGGIYRVQGLPGDWTIKLHARGGTPWNPSAVTAVQNDIIYLTREGVSSLSGATEYGDYRMGQVGVKINPQISTALTESCRAWHLPSRGQVWISDGQTPVVWCYHYMVNQAWTKLVFQNRINDVVEIGGETYVAMANAVYRLSDSRIDDDGTPIQAKLKARTIGANRQVMVKNIRVEYQASGITEAKFKMRGFELPLPQGGQLPEESVSSMRSRCRIRDYSVTPEIEIIGGGFELSSMILEIAEV